jgi:D-alanyl-D-alanine carboxypeptidase
MLASARSSTTGAHGSARLRRAGQAACAAVLIALPLAAQSARPAGSGSDVARRVDSLVAAYQRETRAPGVSVALIRGGRDTLAFRGYGLANVENDVPATAATVYRIGSLTKQFTAAAVMKLVEERRLTLDDSLGQHLPQVPAAWRGIRIRQLLNHTSGIHEFTDAAAFRTLQREDISPDSAVGLVRADTLDFAPGTGWRYSNTGYLLLGLVIEKVTGQPYARFVESRLVAPLGLASTRYCSVAPLIAHRAAGYERVDTAVANARYISMSIPFAAGALCSTVGDLAAWNRALATGSVVTAASYARMTTPEGAAAGQHYGFGLAAVELDGHRVILHTGGINGFVVVNAYLPDDSLSATVLTNYATADPGPLLRNMVSVVLGLPLPPPSPPPLTLTAAQLLRYAIEEPGGPREVEVIARADGLVFRTGERMRPLVAIAPDTFRFGDVPQLVRLTFTVERGQATGFTLEGGGNRRTARRIP